MAEYLHHTSCDSCGSSDANAVYADGSAWCWSCQVYTPSEGQPEMQQTSPKPTNLIPLSEIEPISITKRGLKEDTLKTFGVGKHGSDLVCTYRDPSGKPVAQKVRTKTKDFRIVGSGKDLPLFGIHRASGGGKMVVVTEGELDALAASQALSIKHTWPVVSVPSGASDAPKAISRHIEWLESFESIVLAFDNDEPGRAAAQACAEILDPTKVKVAVMPEGCKDACDALAAGKGSELRTGLFNAKPFSPAGIVGYEDFSIDDLMAPSGHGYLTGFPRFDEDFVGLRKGELTMLAAGSGVGKSTLAKQWAHMLWKDHGLRVGHMYLEEGVQKSLQTFVALENDIALNRLRLDPSLLPREKWESTVDRLKEGGRMSFLDHFGSLDSGSLLAKLKYMATGLKCDFIVLDHISIVISGQKSSGEGERRDIDRLMTALRQLIEQTGVGIIAITHLTKSEGTSHEEGGRVTLDHLRGSGTLKQIPDSIIAIERDQQDPEGGIALMRGLKNREHGIVGPLDSYAYNRETGVNEVVTGFEDQPQPQDESDF